MRTQDIVVVVLLSAFVFVIFMLVTTCVISKALERLAYGQKGKRSRDLPGFLNSLLRSSKKPMSGNTSIKEIFSTRPVLSTKDNAPIIPRYGVGDTFKDRTGTSWIVDSVLLTITKNGKSLAVFNTHNKKSGVYALFTESARDPGIFDWDAEYLPLPVKMSDAPIPMHVPRNPDRPVVCFPPLPPTVLKSMQRQPEKKPSAVAAPAPVKEGASAKTSGEPVTTTVEDPSESPDPIPAASTPVAQPPTVENEKTPKPFTRKRSRSSGKKNKQKAAPLPEPSIFDMDNTTTPNAKTDVPAGTAAQAQEQPVSSTEAGLDTQPAVSAETEVSVEPIDTEAAEPQPPKDEKPVSSEEVNDEPSDTAPAINRFNKEHRVHAWQLTHPDGSRTDCETDTGISLKDVNIWWEEALASDENKKPSREELCDIVRGWQLIHKTDGTKGMCAIECGLNEEEVDAGWDDTLGKSAVVPTAAKPARSFSHTAPKKRRTPAPGPTLPVIHVVEEPADDNAADSAPDEAVDPEYTGLTDVQRAALQGVAGTAFAPKNEDDKGVFLALVDFRDKNPKACLHMVWNKFGAKNRYKIERWWSFACPDRKIS